MTRCCFFIFWFSLLLVGCAPALQETLHGSFESKFVRYAQGQKHQAQNNPEQITRQWCDTAWRNDRVHTQIVLWVDADSVSELSYRVSDLVKGSQKIGYESIQLRFPSYILGDSIATRCKSKHTRTQTYIADALSETPRTSVNASDPVKIWVTIDVPENTAHGLYSGTIEVLVGGEKVLTFELNLQVADRTLPEPRDWKFHLDIWQFPFQLTKLCNDHGARITPFSPQYFDLMRPFYAILADAGQKVVTTYIKDGAFELEQTMVRWQYNQDDTWSFDYADFDAYVEFMASLGIDKQISCFSLFGWNKSIGYQDQATQTYKVMPLAISSPEYKRVWSAFLVSFHQHLIQKGWFDKTVLYLDESRGTDTRDVIAFIRATGVDWKIGLAGSHTKLDVEKELYDYSPIYGSVREWRQPISTYYTSCEQTIPNNYVSLDNSPAEMTWMIWYAAAQKLDGYLRWAFDFWLQADPNNVQDASNTAGDSQMIYRTDNSAQSKPVNSIRFELLREGVQDFEKIRLLANPIVDRAVVQVQEATAVVAAKQMTQLQGVLKAASMQSAPCF